MKKILITCIVLLSFSSLLSGPFLKIDKINHSKKYPMIELFLSVINTDSLDISGLDEENLYIFEDGYRVNYTKVINHSKIEDYLYMVFSFDSSRSIGKKSFYRLKQSAKDIIKKAGPRDYIAIYNFDNTVKLIENFTAKKDVLFKTIDTLKTKGSKTLLYNSIYDSLDHLTKERGQNKRKAVIVFTDGKDEGSSVKIKDLISFSRDVKIPIYFICIKKPRNASSIKRIAKLTGGKLLISGKRRNIKTFYKQILSKIKSSYIIKYDSRLKNDGLKHTVEVRLKYKHMRDRDVISFTAPKRFLNLNFNYIIDNLILILIILLLIILIVILILILTRQKNTMPVASSTNIDLSDVHHGYNDTEYDYTDDEDDLLTPDDPSYVYSDVWLIEKNGPSTGQKYQIHWDEVTLGRSEDNTVSINDKSVSPYHAKIKNINNTFHLFDLISDNGTYLNNRKLLRPKPLNDWDEIKIGRAVFIFRGSRI